MAFEFQLIEAGPYLVVAFSGELDSRSAPKLEKALEELLNAGKKVLVFDCVRLDFLTSAGLRVFLVAGKRLSGQGGHLLLAGLNPSVREVFEISGFGSLFETFPTREAALSWIESHGVRSQLSHFVEGLIARHETHGRGPAGLGSGLARERAALAARILMRSRSTSPAES